MNDEPIQRDLVSSQAARSKGNVPNLEGFAKAKIGEMPNKGERRTRRHDPPPEDDGEWRRQVWMFVGGVLAFVLIGLTVYAWGKHRFGDATSSDVPHHSSARMGGDTGHSEVSEFPSNRLAEEVVRKAMAAREERLVSDYFRIVGDTQQADVVDFLESMTARDGLIVGLQADEGVRLNDQPLGRVWVRMERGGVEKKRLAYLVRGLDGSWKVDFDSFARLVAPNWDELTQKQVVIGVVRVCVMPIVGGDDEWNRFLISSPDLSFSPLALCRTGSAQDLKLAELLQQSLPQSVSRELTLAVRKNGELSMSAFEIIEVLADGWVVPDEDEESEK